MVEFEVRETPSSRAIGVATRVAHEMDNWEWVSYAGRRYQLFGGIRGPYWIDLSNPIRRR
jgi:hypothetical protein